MEALFTSALTVCIAEIGDKTQLLALLLAARFRQKTAIITGILLSTLANHLLAAWLGHWTIAWLTPTMARYLIAASFFAIALWMLVPDKADDEDSRFYRYGPFLATFVLFFLAEMGDKTQISTVVLAAKFQALTLVVLGTTLGILLANVPVVMAGSMGGGKLPVRLIQRICALLFSLLGLATLLWY
ncbi:TMEM165/GDT1 family protein [Shewanella sp. YIC-542]|uniref:TMEM165/GDT1 family protein n=1 Tax=Shewanella mytili TaxID=3377111 RepID=UPI00398E7851